MSRHGVARNYRVVGLKEHAVRFTVITQQEGEEPVDTKMTPGEFVDPAELDGFFGYFTRAEKAILRSGFTRSGAEKVPGGRRKRR